MNMVKKEQGQDDSFSQQSCILLTLPTYISPLSSTYLGWVTVRSIRLC